MIRIADLEHGCAGSPLEGDGITVVGEQQGQKFLESKLHLKKCYVLEQYSCIETPKYQRVMKNTVHLSAGEASKITMDEKEKIPQSFFDFASVDQLHTFLDTPTYFPDFLGKYKKQTLRNKRNGDPFLLLMLIDVAGSEITITLWKECMQDSEKVNIDALSTTTPETLIAVSNVKATTYSGSLRLSSTDATHMIISPQLHPHSKQHQQLTTMAAKSPITSSDTIMTLEELQSKPYETILVIVVDARIIETDIGSSWYTASRLDCKAQIKQRDIWLCPNHGPKSDPNFFYSVRTTLSDGTMDLQTMTTDSCMQKLFGRTYKETIMEDGYDDRKILPPSFRKEGMNTHRFYIEMTKKSTPSNINFVVINKETSPYEPPQPQAATTNPKQPETTLTIVETTHTTPPPQTPATPDSDKKGTTSDTTKATESSKPPVARQLSFQSPDHSHASNTITEIGGKRKHTEKTDEFMSISPTKRERFPE